MSASIVLSAKAESQHHKVTVGKKSNVQSMLGNQQTYRSWRLFVKNSGQLCYSGETEDSYNITKDDKQKRRTNGM